MSHPVILSYQKDNEEVLEEHKVEEDDGSTEGEVVGTRVDSSHK